MVGYIYLISFYLLGCLCILIILFKQEKKKEKKNTLIYLEINHKIRSPLTVPLMELFSTINENACNCVHTHT